MAKISDWLKENYILTAFIFLAAVLRFYNVDFQSVWIDEIHTMVETSSSLSHTEFYDLMLKRELMPHLYYIIVRFFSNFVGDSVLVVRSISAFIGVVSVGSIYFLGKELHSKKAGLLASLFLAVNHFHIFYSQEARPYILLSLFTILSFLFLSRFIRRLTLKSAIYYSVFAALMINTHFFGLFVLASQVMILLIYLLIVENKHRKKLFINSAISGGIIILLFIPSIPILLKISKINSIWIPPPTNTFFKGLFNGFFGKSEFLIYTAVLCVILFFVKVFSQKESHITKYNNKYLRSFVFLIVWLFIIFIIPYIRSYTNVPMLLNRYFMSALPAVILILAIGLSSIKSKLIIVIITVIFVSSSFVDLFLVKDYYERVNKTQFREITAEVALKNTENSPVVYHKSWHMDYFFDKEEATLINSSLDNYVNKVRKGKSEMTSFWIIDGHFRPYKATPKNQVFLNENFYLIDEIEYFDIWAKYYLHKNKRHITDLNLGEFTPKYSQNGSYILIVSNSTIKSKKINVKKGKYRLSLQTKSKPKIPINNENAHVEVSISGKRIGGFYTNSKEIETTFFDFNIEESTNITIEFTFGNDYFSKNDDRDLIIYGASIEKLKEQL